MKINQAKFTGGYKCPHFQLQKSQQNKKKGCCGGSGDDYTPVCTLANAVCPGLIHCPRLDVKTKGELIKQWRSDLQKNKMVAPKVK